MTANRNPSPFWVTALAGCNLALWFFLASPFRVFAGERTIPEPLPDHPGNIFLEGEEVAVPLRVGQGTNGELWRLADFEGRDITNGLGVEGHAVLGRLPVGYYELSRLSNGLPEKPPVTVGVLARLRAPTPPTSPIGVDAGLAWNCPEIQQAPLASLCALAGINWIRDRLSWRDLEPTNGEFASGTKYNNSVGREADAGLQVLQVYHDSPPWANPNAKRQPLDLRDAFQFAESVARRWRGQVLAIEPWNEADIEDFGGHTGAEMATYQKAAYLGLKAGNPNLTVCQNVFASPHPNVLADFNANYPSPYFDTFNLHHYCSLDEYPAVYAAFRPVAAGKPIWVTEFSLPVQWAGTAEQQEPTAQNLRLQAERVAQLFASALYEGPAVAFYFELPHYCEGQVQFGVLHKDLTPRPGYVALAAVGRLLADAKPLGKLRVGRGVRLFAFRARPDGLERDVMVAWTTQGQETLALPVTPLAFYDHLGRASTNAGRGVVLSSAPHFAVFPPEALKAVSWLRPTTAARARQPDAPLATVVLQATLPKERIIANLSAYRCSLTETNAVPVFAYNFGAEKVVGRLSATCPDGWQVALAQQVELAPGERKQLTLLADCSGGTLGPVGTVRIVGEFGSGGVPVLSFQLAPQPVKMRSGPATAIVGANDPTRWQPSISSGGELNISRATGGGLTFEASMETGDRWVYPVLVLSPGEKATPGCVAVAATIASDEGAAEFRVIFEEENRSQYFAGFFPQPKPGETVETVALLSAAMFGEGWSPPDDNGRLDLEKIKQIKIGCNPGVPKVRYTIKNLRWLRPVESGSAGK